MILDVGALRNELDSWRERAIDNIIERRRSGKIQDGRAEFRERAGILALYNRLRSVIVQASKDLRTVQDIVLDRTGYRVDSSHYFIGRSGMFNLLGFCGDKKLEHPVELNAEGIVVCPICDKRLTRRLYVVVYSRRGEGKR